ncbi:receptor like protein 34 [Artemisia annua]|uniref:Receptor like protein 34 n=1 Tax=Artemisia annua TaxID=35608 RepID=A0A2U1MG18_ARTAN|nr:receptor like protein 34 [Artemisia annua]
MPMRFLLFLLYVLQSTLATKLSSSSQSFSHNDECTALIQFKNKMFTNKSVSSDPLAYPKVASWKVNSSKGGTNCCLWDGVECSDKTSGHVIRLDLNSCFLYGTINSTSSLFDLIHLRRLNLADNCFNFSQIPSEIGRFSRLKRLDFRRDSSDIRGNQITLSVNNNHTNSTPPKIAILNLGSCNLRAFPHFLRFQNQLQELYLDDNNISGLIPEWMGSVSKQTLQTLLLSKNSLTGFEKNWPVIPWVGLRLLDLSHNMLHGSIPLYNSLLVLNLRGNVLRGTIPNTFTNGRKLLMINLSENQLEGQLPRSLDNCASFQILDLGNNHIDDMYPFWLGALPELQVLILGSNKLHGTIRITAVDFSSNKFRGIILDSIKELSGLQLLNLSNNEFSGVIPSSKGSLTQMESLDLSSNMLEGRMSQELVQLNFLEVLNVSYNNLTGPIPQGKQFKTFMNNSYMGNLGLCGDPLSKKCCKSDDVSKPPTVTFEQDTDSDFPSGVDWVVILSELGSGLVIGLLFGNHLTTRFYKWYLERFKKW